MGGFAERDDKVQIESFISHTLVQNFGVHEVLDHKTIIPLYNDTLYSTTNRKSSSPPVAMRNKTKTQC